MIDEPGLDTYLARELHRRGLATGPLRAALEDARRERAQPGGQTLARRLLRERAVSEPLLREALAAVAPGANALEHSLAASREGAFAGRAGPPHDPWQPGRRVGDYVLKERLGAGAMGLVFVAEHAETGARYALKTCPLHAEGEHLARFRREGEAQARVDAHPSILRVHALHEVDGRPFLIMDLAEGGDLDRRVRREGPLAPPAAAALVRDLARGLAHMHARGVLHRDLKPANVLFDERGAARLVDFGLARFDGGQSLTHTGDLIGTPAFMAPEQALGRRDRVGPPSDVYGLGSVLFYALTGRAPARGSQVVEVLRDVIEGPVPSPRELRPEVPLELDAICRAALAKEREERPDAAGLADALEGWLERPARLEPARRPWRAASLASALAGVAALGAIGLSAGGAGGEPSAPQPAPAAAAAPAPAPPSAPARAAPEPLWRWPAGETRRFRLCNAGSMTNVLGRGELLFTRTLDLAWSALESSGRALRLEATVERLAIETGFENTAWGSFSFDSARSSDGGDPGMAAIGRRFTFTLDPVTGRVDQVAEVTAVQAAIYAAAKKDDAPLNWLERHRWQVWELSSETVFEHLLEALVRVRPEEVSAEQDAWLLAGAAPPGLDRVLGFEVVPLELEVRARREGGLLLSWAGERDQAEVGVLGRELAGEARYDEDGLRAARVQDTWDGRAVDPQAGSWGRGRGGERAAELRARRMTVVYTLTLERR